MLPSFEGRIEGVPGGLRMSGPVEMEWLATVGRARTHRTDDGALQ
jgi:hypothetical protein